jgi:hypothetical protein
MHEQAFEQNLGRDLHQYLASKKLLDARMPECPDVEDQWEYIVKAYIPDGVREFNAYPVASLGWIIYIGMAMAKFWDTEWDIYSKVDNVYAYLKSKRGYDCMDDYIKEEVLLCTPEESVEINDIASDLAARTYNVLMHQHITPGTSDAFYAYVSCLHQLYLMGMSLELHRLGYHMEKI